MKNDVLNPHRAECGKLRAEFGEWRAESGKLRAEFGEWRAESEGCGFSTSVSGEAQHIGK